LGSRQTDYKGETQPQLSERTDTWLNLTSLFPRSYQKSSLARLFGAVLGLVVWAYLWFRQPDIGLDPQATKLLGLLCLTLIYWIFWVFPDYGVALIFALGLILSGVGKADVVLGGFARHNVVYDFGSAGSGCGVTGSGLFTVSRCNSSILPLNYYWQIVAWASWGYSLWL
jgi:hypothetical protein